MTVQSRWAASDGTTTINFFYDSAPNGRGRLWYTYDANQEGTANWSYNQHVITAYDALGRPTNFRQDFFTPNGSGGNTQYSYSGSRTYDLAGHLTTQTYPSGKQVQYAFDQAGRLSQFSGNLGRITTALPYLSQTKYTAAGALERERYGATTPLFLKQEYNTRQQLVGLRLSSVDPQTGDPNDWNRGWLRYLYSTLASATGNPQANGPDNNGNVIQSLNYVPKAGGGYVITQNQIFHYDELNRLKDVTEWCQDAPPNGAWQETLTQVYSYDRWGNRQIASATGTNINNKQFAIDTATNRLGVPAGQSGALEYDAAGNQTRDTWSNGLSGSGNPDAGKRWYNADGKMTAAHDGTQWQRSRYDASGRRVKRRVGQSGANGEVWQVYDPDGLLLVEYPKQGATNAPVKEYGYRGGKLLVIFDSTETGDRQLQWLAPDHLGSTRMTVDKSGSLAGIRRHDFLPFGEELTTGMGTSSNRGSQYGYVADNVRQKYATYERDSETGLDYAQARYCANVQGRFTSVDPQNAGAIPYYPQTWNAYTYVINNPLTYIDPDGLKVRVCYDGNCNDYSDAQWPKSRQTLTDNGFTVTDGRIFNDAGNQVGTYRRISDDRWSDFQNALFFGNSQDPGLAGRATATKQLIGTAAAAGVVGGAIGGAALTYGGLAVTGTLTTLGNLGRVAAPAATGGAAFINQLGKTDARMFQEAIRLGLSATNGLSNNLNALTAAVRQIRPDAQLNYLGNIGNSQIYGSLVSGVGIAEVNGVTVVVRVVQGSPQIIGQLP
jgi:RHS repeat-associated protein